MLLICEGPCNPGISTLDEGIREWREKVDPGMECAAVPPDAVVEELRALKHTEHRQMGTFAACNSCGCVRIYG